jgi:hypothetical protein
MSICCGTILFYCSGIRRVLLQAALLIFPSGAARARIVTPDLAGAEVVGAPTQAKALARYRERR